MSDKPRITKLKNGGWLCAGGNLGGTGWTPQRAYWAWSNHPARLTTTQQEK